MAAGSGAASSQGARGSTAAFESSLDRRFQGVSNTMESIQGLSTWCIENKKYHSLIVRCWMKWLKKSDTSHRLNLFYLANDVIQNCKRKNAIAFRSAFAEVLPNAALLVKDGKVRKSVERIFNIWEERSVYPEELITQLKGNLTKKDKEREREKEKQKEKEKEKEKKEKEKTKETPAPSVSGNGKAALKSKIVAEFTPNLLVDQLSCYKRAVEEEHFREKQLTALRVDVCSTEALKRLKDKAGGNKFAKDFEEGSLKLQEFVSFLEEELKTGPPLIDALGNADIFYEMQYKEVKIVANAYNAFASRVASLKRKLDALKSSLPGHEESPIPSPSVDAPSPSGSDSPYQGLGMAASRAQLDPELDGRAMDEGELARDNRDSEDMDMSDEETDSSNIQVDEKKDKTPSAVSKVTKLAPSSKLTLPVTPSRVAKTSSASPVTPTPGTPSTPSGPATPLGVNLANVDLGKISSILSSITSAMKSTGPSPSSRPSPGTPTTPSGQSAASKAAPPSPALASILSRVDISPEGILNALSKTKTPGLSTLLQSVANPSSTNATRGSPEGASAKAPLTPTTPKAKPVLGNSLKRDGPARGREWENEREQSPSPPPPPPPPPTRPLAPPTVALPSLESKINSFLQGNPAFSLGLGDSSPLAGDGVDGTPVRDEAAGTPTQDEMMDTPSGGLEPLSGTAGHSLSPTAYRSDPWDAVITPTGSSDGDFLSSSSSSSRYGIVKKNATKSKEEDLMAAKMRAQGSGSSETKGRKDGAGGRRASGDSRKGSASFDEGALGGKRDNGVKGHGGGASPREQGQYHRIETLVSPCTEGAPIQALGYSNRPAEGEPIRTVESIRVIGRGLRRGGGGASGRPGGAMWYEEEEYMEAQPTSPHGAVGQGPPDDMPPAMQPPPPPPPPPPPHLLLPPHHHPPPPPTHPHAHPHPLPPMPHFQMPYHGEKLHGAPPLPAHLHQPPPPPPTHFFGVPPPIPRPPPPPMPQLPPSPRSFPAPPSAVMVGGVLVPVDRPLPQPPPPANRHDAAERGGGGPRGGKGGPPPLMTSLLGEPPKLPRPGTVKEAFAPRHAPPLHRPGTPGAPPPLLGRVKEPLNLPPHPPSPTPPSPSTPTPPSPSGEIPSPHPAGLPQSPAPPLQRPAASPPPQPRSQGPAPNRPTPPVPLLTLPKPRPPVLSVPIPQRPLLQTPLPNLDRNARGFRGNKRPGPPFQGGSFHHPKRPFLPPRY